MLIFELFERTCRRLIFNEIHLWHHQPDRHEFEQALGVGDGQGSLACCSPWGRMTRGFSVFEAALLAFEAQVANIKQYRKVAAAVQNAIQCYHVICDESKELLPRHHWVV